MFLWLDSETDVVFSTTELWSPTDSNSNDLIAWYDASNTDSITGNPTVTALDDLSVYGGFDLSVQGDPQTSVDTLNSLNTITLTGNDDRLEVLNQSFGATSGNLIIAGVSVIGTVNHERDAIWSFKDVDGTNNDIHLRAGNSSQFNGAFETEGLGSGGAALSGGITRNFSGGPYTGATLHCTIINFDNGDIFGRMNGTQRVSITNEYFTKVDLNNADLYIHSNRSGNRKLEGKFCEIMIWESNDEDLAKKIEGYLGHKWGISLPGGHPYQSSPPTGFCKYNKLDR